MMASGGWCEVAIRTHVNRATIGPRLDPGTAHAEQADAMLGLSG
jgi:hypothetical protein